MLIILVTQLATNDFNNYEVNYAFDYAFISYNIALQKSSYKQSNASRCQNVSYRTNNIPEVKIHNFSVGTVPLPKDQLLNEAECESRYEIL
jgi:hypothetical protein